MISKSWKIILCVLWKHEKLYVKNKKKANHLIYFVFLFVGNSSYCCFIEHYFSNRVIIEFSCQSKQHQISKSTDGK